MYLVWLNKAFIPNFSFLGGLEVTQIYLSGWVEWVGGVTMILIRQSQFDLTSTGLLELSLAKKIQIVGYMQPKGF